MVRQKERELARAIALERITILFNQAKELVNTDHEAALRRVQLAYRIALRCNVRIPKEFKLRFCRKCLNYFTSKTMCCRLNTREHRIEYKCLNCGHIAFIPYKRRKKGH